MDSSISSIDLISGNSLFGHKIPIRGVYTFGNVYTRKQGGMTFKAIAEDLDMSAAKVSKIYKQEVAQIEAEKERLRREKMLSQRPSELRGDEKLPCKVNTKLPEYIVQTESTQTGHRLALFDFNTMYVFPKGFNQIFEVLYHSSEEAMIEYFNEFFGGTSQWSITGSYKNVLDLAMDINKRYKKVAGL